MPKAILELEMPESYWDCKLASIPVYMLLDDETQEKKPAMGWCGYSGKKCPDKGRRSDCPLKLVDNPELPREESI